MRSYHGGPRLIRITCLLAFLIPIAIVPTTIPAFELRWSLGGGIGQPTEVGYYVGPSPRAGGSIIARLTDRTLLGLMGDYVSYRTKRPETDGFQWRALMLVEWEVGHGPLPTWCQPFGQLGIGAGRMEYVGVTGLEVLVGPASRLAAGLSFRLNRRLTLTTTLSFDRLDTAPNGMDRHYPTMLNLSLAIAFHWPRGAPLFPSPAASYRGR